MEPVFELSREEADLVVTAFDTSTNNWTPEQREVFEELVSRIREG